MLRFSKRADYGLMAVHYIAFHQHDGVVTARRIAEDLGVPAELLAKVLQRLAKRKLIKSVNGPKGGYVLTRDPGRISVGEVLRAIDGPVGIVHCYQDYACPQLDRCTIRKPIRLVQTRIDELLNTISLEALNRFDGEETGLSLAVSAGNLGGD